MHYNESSDDYPYHRSRRHRSRSRSGGRDSSKFKLIVILAVCFAFESMYLLFSYISMNMLEYENLDLNLAERKQTQELETLRPEFKKLGSDIAMLNESRLPDLIPLEVDKVIEMDKDYVKNIVFTASGKGEDKHYEYKMVMHNSTLNLIHPQVDILFFDQIGIQVGLSRLGVQKDGTPTLEVMERGEIRSFSSQLELTHTNTPNYFRLRIWH